MNAVNVNKLNNKLLTGRDKRCRGWVRLHLECCSCSRKNFVKFVKNFLQIYLSSGFAKLLIRQVSGTCPLCCIAECEFMKIICLLSYIGA